jgi:hypothetical protein
MKLSTLKNVEKVISTLSVGLVMVQNTTNPHSPTAKHSTFGREGRMQPLSSFFPLGFLTPPDREPFVDVVIFMPSFYIIHDFNFAPPPLLRSFITCEGVNLRITYAPHHVCLSLFTCLLHCLVMDSQLILSSPITFPTFLKYSLSNNNLSQFCLGLISHSFCEFSSLCFLSGFLWIGFHHCSYSAWANSGVQKAVMARASLY